MALCDAIEGSADEAEEFDRRGVRTKIRGVDRPEVPPGGEAGDGPRGIPRPDGKSGIVLEWGSRGRDSVFHLISSPPSAGCDEKPALAPVVRAVGPDGCRQTGIQDPLGLKGARNSGRAI